MYMYIYMYYMYKLDKRAWLPCADELHIHVQCTCIMAHTFSTETLQCNYYSFTKYKLRKCKGCRDGVPKPQKLGVGMAVCRQVMLYKDYTSNSNPTSFLYPTSFCGLCYEITGKSTLKQKSNLPTLW